MDKLENKFSIRRIRKPSDNDYIQALKIYNEQTPVSIKTNTNEISHWLINKKEHKSFELMVFTLYLDDKVIGFAMISYVAQYKIIIIDYMALSTQYRVNTTFFTYLNLLQNYLIETATPVNYYVVEISNKDNGNNIDRESRFFRKLICLEDFNKLDAQYYTLQLGIDDYESNFEAFIYIKSVDSTSNISKDTYLNIVKSIYYSYYEAWYVPFLTEDEKEQYKAHIDSQYELIKKSIMKLDKIENKSTICPLQNTDLSIKTNGQIPSKKSNKKYYLILLIVLLGVLGSVVIVFFIGYLLSLLNIQFGSVDSSIGVIFSSVVTSFITISIANKKL